MEREARKDRKVNVTHVRFATLHWVSGIRGRKESQEKRETARITRTLLVISYTVFGRLLASKRVIYMNFRRSYNYYGEQVLQKPARWMNNNQRELIYRIRHPAWSCRLIRHRAGVC